MVIEENIVLGLTFVVQFRHMEEKIIIGSSTAPVVLHTWPINTDQMGSLSMSDVPVLVTVDLIHANMHSVMGDVPVLVTVDLIYANMHSVMGDVPVLVTVDLIHANMHSVMGDVPVLVTWYMQICTQLWVMYQCWWL